MTCRPIETVTDIPTNSSAGKASSTVLSGAHNYRLTISGSYRYSKNPSGEADAEWARVGPTYDWIHNPPSDGLDVRVNAEHVEWLFNNTLTFNPGHVYVTEMDGRDATVTFSVADSGYSDNIGTFTVAIEECGDAKGPPPSVGERLNETTEPPQEPIQPPQEPIQPPQEPIQPPLVNVSPPAPVSGEMWNKPYPRIGVQQFGSAPAAWYAKFDLVMLPSSTRGAAIKSLNPSTIVMPTRGWSGYNGNRYFIPSEDFDRAAYVTHDSSGNDVEIAWNAWLIDQSIFAAQRKGTAGRYAGKSILEAIPLEAIRFSDPSTNDGVATDWLWDKARPSKKDIDFDRDGQNDYEQHGGNWLVERWADGTTELLKNLRTELDRAAPGKAVLINWGFSFISSDNALDKALQYINGMERERTSSFGDFTKFWNKEYQNFMLKSPEPHVSIIDGAPSGEDPWVGDHSWTEAKNHLQALRYLLAGTLMGDAYFSFQSREERPASAEHHIHAWYDEFDVDLGKAVDLGPRGPLGDAQQLKAGIWVRFFEKGAAVVNVVGKPQAVTSQELSALATSIGAYAGPYYRFRGGQDSALNGASNAKNNGELFTSLTLDGYTFGADKVIGDGIILVNSQKTVVSDIVVDTGAFSTSPTNKPAQLNGFTLQLNGGDKHWSVYKSDEGRTYGGVEFWHPFASATAAANAVFTPTIGIAGPYEVFERHGAIAAAATGVTHTIRHAGGQTTKTVNQADNAGRWNSLGTYTFSAGSSDGVTITTTGASGTVIADAIMFAYRG